MPVREVRTMTLDNVTVRAEGDNEIRVGGHAAVWDKPAWIGPPKYGFSERFSKGAFSKTINDGADVRYLFNHNPDHVLARTKSGTLHLSENATGLNVDASLAPTTIGRDLAILMERRDVNQMSVGMQVIQDKWEEVEGKDGNIYEQRTITEARLFDVSAVTYPAYEETDAGLRMADAARESRDARGQFVKRIDGMFYTLDEVRELESRVSTKPWGNFTASDYTIEQWRRACLLDTGEGDPDSKERYKFPVREPDGALNLNGIHAAAQRFTGVNTTPEKKKALAKKIIALYRQIKEDPPDSLLHAAGMAASIDRAQYPADVSNEEPQASTPDETTDPSGDEEKPESETASDSETEDDSAEESPAVDERKLSKTQMILRHFEGDHIYVPRALCPVCAKAEPPTGTQPPEGTSTDS